MGTSHTSPNEWMLNDGTGKSTVFGDERGWVRVQPDGQEVVIQCMTGVLAGGSIPTVSSIVLPESGNYNEGDTITFIVNWSEPVVITGTPQITFEENGSSVSANMTDSTSTNTIFSYVLTDVGDVDNLTQSVQLNGGSIVSADDSVNANLTFTASLSGVIVVA